MTDRKSIQEAMKQQTIENIRSQTDDFYKELVQQNTNGRLPENIFVGYFLPYFSGQKPIDKSSQVMADWISIAGTPMNEVDILDQSGNTIYTVPSLFDTNIIKVNSRKEGESIADIYNQYDLRMNNIPSVANNFLLKALDKKIEDLNTQSTIHDNNVTRWNSILSRYGLNTTKTSDQKDTDIVDDVIYD